MADQKCLKLAGHHYHDNLTEQESWRKSAMQLVSLSYSHQEHLSICPLNHPQNCPSDFNHYLLKNHAQRQKEKETFYLLASFLISEETLSRWFPKDSTFCLVG